MKLVYLPNLAPDRRSRSISIEGVEYRVRADGTVDIDDAAGRQHLAEFEAHGFRVVDAGPYVIEVLAEEAKARVRADERANAERSAAAVAAAKKAAAKAAAKEAEDAEK